SAGPELRTVAALTRIRTTPGVLRLAWTLLPAGNEAPLVTAVMFSSAGLYLNVKSADWTPAPSLSVIGRPLLVAGTSTDWPKPRLKSGMLRTTAALGAITKDEV